MAVPLLATKWYIPPAGQRLIDRPQLLAKLNECLHPRCRLGLVSAPAGFGKTTIVSMWAAAAKALDANLKVAWLTVEDGDNDPVAFWTYVISALRTQHEGLGSLALSLLQTARLSDLEGSLAGLVNELACISHPFALILDDYHLIRNPEIQRTVAYWVEHLPPQCHLLLVSRTDPPLPLALLRGRGQLLEIRLNELRFSMEDALAYLNTGMELNLPDRAVEAINDKTEGWIAGLQMAALSLRAIAGSSDRNRLEKFVASFSGSNRYILDYLLEEVLNRQTPELQDFLLRTSILDRLWGPLCDALLIDRYPDHHPASQAILESLEGANLFIIPLDDERCCYRYHHLFADLLRKRLSQIEPAAVPELHRRAALWYEQNSLIPKAVSHAFQAKDLSKAAALVNEIVEEMWGRGEHATLLEWIDALPEAEKSRYPQLWVYQGSMLITAGRLQEADRCVKQIEAYLQSSSDAYASQASMMGRISSLRAYIASFFGDIPSLLHYAHLALDNLTRSEDAGGRCGINLVLSNAYLNRGELEAAARALEEAIEAGRLANRPSMVLTAMANLAIVAYTQGNLRRAGQVCQEGILLIQRTGLAESPTAANLYIGQGLILCERHELGEAESCISRGLELARERGYIWGIAWGYRGLLRLLLAKGDLAGADSIIEEAEQLALNHEIPEYHACGLSGLKATIWIQLGKIDQAERHLQQRSIRDDSDIRYPHESEYLALARLHLVKGDLERAEGLLERLHIWEKTAKQNLWVIRILVMQAIVGQAQGDRERCLQSLSLALDLAQAEGYVQTFADEGDSMRTILMDASQRRLHQDYVQTLLVAFPNVPPAISAAKPTSITTPALREPLSEREIAVVALIADGLTNKEIAQRLHISLRTVKYYTTNLFTKMDVKGRAQAAVRARELGLLK